jgi:hypothetical protein
MEHHISQSDIFKINFLSVSMPIPVAEKSKARVCGLSPAGITGSNPAGGMEVTCECCVLPGRYLCDGPITLQEEFYRLSCVVCDLETSIMWRQRPGLGCCFRGEKRVGINYVIL